MKTSHRTVIRPGKRYPHRLRFLVRLPDDPPQHCAAGLALLGLVMALVSGCANSAIATARSEIATGQYATAHRTFVQAAANTRLSQRERREVADGLCFTEYKIGAPQYSLSQQHQTCTVAVEEAGSESRPILAQVEWARRTQWSERAAAAIRDGDFAEAEAAIVRYQSLPGADPRLVSTWSHQLWAAVERDDTRPQAQTRTLAPAISQLSRLYPQVKAMSNPGFRRWIEDNMTISGTPLVSDIQIGKRTINLWIPDNELGLAAVNLDRFARINNAQVARCRCDGRTNIARQGSGLPAYLVRLDPATRRSEVLILVQP